MASVFKGGGKKPKWVIEFTDERGRRRRKTGFTDKALTYQLAAKLERQVAERKAGLPVDRIAEARLPLLGPGGLVGQYVAELTRLGRTAKYVRRQEFYLLGVIGDCGWKTVGDMTPRGLAAVLTKVAAKGRGGRTQNAYRDACNQFCRHLVRLGVVPENPLARVTRVNQTREPRRYRRRAFTLAEFAKFVGATERAAPARAFAYRLAAYTGFRRGELAKLERRDFVLPDPENGANGANGTSDRALPSWAPRAEIVKNRKRLTVPMTLECAELIAGHKAGAYPPKKLLCPAVASTDVFKADLKRAGLTRKDAADRVLDWHSLRYFFCAQLAKHLPIQTVKALMRHASIQQTCDTYLEIGLDDVTAQVRTLPKLFTE